MLKEILYIGIGGFVGAISRFLLSNLITQKFNNLAPIGILFVNVLGCLILGIIIGITQKTLTPITKSFITIGILGSFTTFSTFAYQTTELIQSGNFWMAGLNIVANLVLGLGGYFLGFKVLTLWTT